MNRIARLAPLLIRLGVSGALFVGVASAALGADGAAALRERYAVLGPKLHTTVFGAPIHLESEDRDGMIRGEVYGVLPHPFAVVSATLQQLPAWCDLTTLHINIKGCSPHADAVGGVLTLYTGGKHYMNPKDARATEFLYRPQDATADYFSVALTSEGGPLDTYDYRLDVEATPLGEQTFAHVRFSYRYRIFTRMLSAMYFGTVARDKIGFSTTGTNAAGEPIYVKGRVAAVERNAMRLYFALQVLLESRAQPEAERFEWRLRRWYALNDKYRRQLYDVDEAEYLESKRQERKDLSPAQYELWPPPNK